MDNITYSQIRIRLAKIMKYLLTDSFSEIYKANCEKYSEAQIRKMNYDLSAELRKFTHDIYINRTNVDKLNSIYCSVKPEMICCFYYRYWVVINLLQSSQQISPREKFAVEEDEENMLYQLLFDVSGL